MQWAGGVHPPGRHPQADTPPPKMTTEAECILVKMYFDLRQVTVDGHFRSNDLIG